MATITNAGKTHVKELIKYNGELMYIAYNADSAIIHSLRKWLDDAIANRQNCIEMEDMADEPSAELKRLYAKEIEAYRNVLEVLNVLSGGHGNNPSK